MSEHTPTPWEACRNWVCEENDPGHNVGICTCEDRETEAETNANAAFIVKAVNSHDALVKALQKIADLPPVEKAVRPVKDHQVIAINALRSLDEGMTR